MDQNQKASRELADW